VCHAGTEQSRWSKTEALQIDQNQCLHLKGYYGFDQPKRGGASGLSRASRLSVVITLPSNERRRGYDSAGTGILHAHL
jgi:hypothetical protein